MPDAIIEIPTATTDSRIGSIFNDVFSVIEQTERHKQHVTWDYRNVTFFHPFFLASLAIYKDALECNINQLNISASAQAYFKAIGYSQPISLSEANDIHNLFKRYITKTYTPLCKFSMGYKDIDPMQTAIQDVIKHQVALRNNNCAKIIPAISYLLGELVCNMQEHSRASHGYLFTQYMPTENTLYICLADNGRTIHGSFIASGKVELISKVGQDHAKALRLSTIGVSTKNRPHNENRGYGISTNTNMIVNGTGGAFFILSGNAFYRHDSNGIQFINLPPNTTWDGTIILVKMPLKLKPEFNVYNYIQ